MKVRFLYATLLLAIVTVKAEGDVVGAGNAVGNNDLGIIVKRDDPGNRGRSINDAVDHSGNEKLTRILENDNFDENQGNVTDSPKPPDTPSSATNSSIPSTDPSDPSTTSSTSSTESSNTSTNSSTSSTESSNTSTNSSTSSTESSNTSTNSSISSSDSPNPSTNSSTLSTDSPNPSTNSSTPEPNLLNQEDYPYQVKRDNGTACILSKMTISLNVTYKNTNDEAISKLINIPSSNVTINGYCSEPFAAMQLTWPIVEIASTEDVNKTSPRMNNITFNLEKNDEDSTFSVFEILVLIRLDPFNFPDALEADILETTGPNLTLFHASAINGKYKCDNPITVNTENVKITLTDVVLIAFNTDDDLSSKSEENCVPTATFVETIHSIEIWGIAGVIGVLFAAVTITIIIGIIMLLRRKNSSNHRMDEFYK